MGTLATASRGWVVSNVPVRPQEHEMVESKECSVGSSFIVCRGIRKAWRHVVSCKHVE